MEIDTGEKLYINKYLDFGAYYWVNFRSKTCMVLVELGRWNYFLHKFGHWCHTRYFWRAAYPRLERQWNKYFTLIIILVSFRSTWNFLIRYWRISSMYCLKTTQSLWQIRIQLICWTLILRTRYLRPTPIGSYKMRRFSRKIIIIMENMMKQTLVLIVDPV